MSRTKGSKNKISINERAYEWYLKHISGEGLDFDEFIAKIPETIEHGKTRMNDVMHWTRAYVALVNGTVTRDAARYIKSYAIENNIEGAEHINIWQMVYNSDYCQKILEEVYKC